MDQVDSYYHESIDSYGGSVTDWKLSFLLFIVSGAYADRQTIASPQRLCFFLALV